MLGKKLKQFITTQPVLQKIFKGILYTEKEDKCNYESRGKNKLLYTSRANEEEGRIKCCKTSNMAGLTTYLSIITLNISGLNSPIKRH
jgi:hypothetical protein